MCAATRSLPVLFVTLVPLTLSAQDAKVETQLLLAPEPGMQYAISPKGLHVAGVVLRGSRQVLVYDGADGPRFDQVLDLKNQGSGGKVAWSEDGSRYGYHGKLGQEYVIVVDGKEVSRGPWSAELQGQGRTPVFHLGFHPEPSTGTQSSKPVPQAGSSGRCCSTVSPAPPPWVASIRSSAPTGSTTPTSSSFLLRAALPATR